MGSGWKIRFFYPHLPTTQPNPMLSTYYPTHYPLGTHYPTDTLVLVLIINVFYIVYLNYILIYSRDIIKHADYVRVVLEAL